MKKGVHQTVTSLDSLCSNHCIVKVRFVTSPESSSAYPLNRQCQTRDFFRVFKLLNTISAKSDWWLLPSLHAHIHYIVKVRFVTSPESSNSCPLYIKVKFGISTDSSGSHPQYRKVRLVASLTTRSHFPCPLIRQKFIIISDKYQKFVKQESGKLSALSLTLWHRG